ncbi:hypothetical protein AAG747_28310 [Rapidithrix thailandica]|uniref:Uncharacterized protein n=1 Tax=Rapidithrix thailandica TaxID=413964 RepID=A0AAW9SL43_9BACT
MKTYLSLEKKSRVLGLPVNDWILLGCLVVGLTLLGGMVNLFVPVPRGYYLTILLLISLVGWVVQKANKQQHPGFLFSFLSFHLVQAKKIVS